MKRQPTRIEESNCKPYIDKGLIARVYKNSYNSNNKKQNKTKKQQTPDLKKGQKT